MSLSYTSHEHMHGRRYPGVLRKVTARHNSKSLLELPELPHAYKLPISHLRGSSLADLVSLQETANGNSGNEYGAHTNEILEKLGIDDRLGFLLGFNDDAHYGATLVRRTYEIVRHYGLISQERPPSQNAKKVFIAVMESLHRDGEFLTKTLIECLGIENLPEAVHNRIGSKLRSFHKDLYNLMSRSIH